MSDIAKVMARLGLRPPPPPVPVPPLLEEQTPAAIAAPTHTIVVQGVPTRVPITGPVQFDDPYYNVHLGLDPVAVDASVARLIANVKRMRRDALSAVAITRATPAWALFRLAP